MAEISIIWKEYCNKPSCKIGYRTLQILYGFNQIDDE